MVDSLRRLVVIPYQRDFHRGRSFERTDVEHCRHWFGVCSRAQWNRDQFHTAFRDHPSPPASSHQWTLIQNHLRVTRPHQAQCSPPNPKPTKYIFNRVSCLRSFFASKLGLSIVLPPLYRGLTLRHRKLRSLVRGDWKAGRQGNA